MAENGPNPLGMTCAAYVRACAEAGVSAAPLAVERYTRLFRDGVTDQAKLAVAVPPVVRMQVSESGEGTVLKFCQRVAGAGSPARPSAGDEARSTSLGVLETRPELETESVLIPMIGKKRVRSYTLCVSSQVGCAMGCGFCQTAQMGLLRSLTAEEIVAQWFAARHLVTRPDPEAEIRNIVFMGMGEPMDNIDSVLAAIDVLTDNRGPGIAPSRVTISTVGRIDGIRKLAARVSQPGWHRLALAVSVNAPNDEVRSKLMPVNRAWPLAELRAVLQEWPFFAGSHLCLEYVLIPGVNDELRHADELGAWVMGDEFAGDADVRRYSGPPLRGLVNVIPYNPRQNSPWPAPSEELVTAFMERLMATGVYVKRRRTKGRDTMAACGQLGNPEMRRKQRAVPVAAAE